MTRSAYALLAILSVTIFVSIANRDSSVAQGPNTVPVPTVFWEYFKLEEENNVTDPKGLNALGKGGWELVSSVIVDEQTRRVRHIFKRRLQ